jgi:hypothetical protein
MPGVTYRAAAKQTVVFTPPGGGGTITTSQVLVRGINVVMFREATLLFRVHDGSTIPAGASVNVKVYSEAPTTEDPATEFVDTNDLLGTPISITSAAVALYKRDIGSTAVYLGGALRIVLEWANTTAGTATTLVLSADIVAKS